MVLYHQILSTRIPAPPLNTVLYCHRFFIYLLLPFSLFICFFLFINGLFLLIIPSYILIYCIAFITPLMFCGVLRNFLRTRDNFLRIRGNFLRIRGNFFRTRGNILRISEKFLRISWNFLRTRENFLRTRGNFLRTLINFLRTSEMQFLHLLLIQNIHFLVLQLRNNGYLHCNYGERLNMPARKCLLNIKGSTLFLD